ncbi:MAG: hypothetical protein OEY86_13225 [Nitrospira sp.]|nr:hypothetical protein [Nitrospira sp.]
MAYDYLSIRLCSRIHRTILASACLALSALIGFIASAQSRETTVSPYSITIDATSIVSQSWWTVPGITPSIWTSDPESSDAYRTSEPRVLELAPGQYKFISFTFDFPFTVTREGAVDFSHTLDQCVGGRGTNTLIVRCKRTYPYGGEPEYSLTP